MVNTASGMIQPWIKLPGFAILILYGAITGCRSSESSSKLVEINVEENVLNVKPLYLGDFDCELRYVPLKGNSIQLKTIILTDFYKDLMLVTDRFNCLLCDLQGNMIAKIGNRGKGGPGEYFLIQSMRFGPQGQIYLQETWTVHEYDMEGNFIHDWKPEVNPERSNTWRGGEPGKICSDQGG